MAKRMMMSSWLSTRQSHSSSITHSPPSCSQTVLAPTIASTAEVTSESRESESRGGSDSSCCSMIVRSSADDLARMSGWRDVSEEWKRANREWALRSDGRRRWRGRRDEKAEDETDGWEVEWKEEDVVEGDGVEEAE